ncbi:MAG: EAL domain-containing protein [Legionellaceae bacterium]|nr:EAL domain-containing protein [Legionellaceae bacterium]
MKTPNNLKSVIDALSQGVLVLDDEGHVVFANHKACVLFDKSLKQIIGSYFTYPIAANETQEIEILGASNKTLIAEMSVKRCLWQNKSAWIVSLNDISERKEKEILSEIVFTGFNAAHEGIIITNSKGRIEFVNPAYIKISGYLEEELIGQNPRILKSYLHDDLFYKQLWKNLENNGCWFGTIEDRRKSGELFSVLINISAIKNTDGYVTNYIGFFNDLTELKNQEKQLQYSIEHDSLTGLPNFYFLIKKLQELMNNHGELDKNIILLAISIEKEKNESSFEKDSSELELQMIKNVSERLKKLSRNKIFLARTGLREFILVYSGESKSTIFNDFSQNVLKKVSQPFVYDNQNFLIKGNIGISIFNKGALSAEDFIHQSEQACFRARKIGLNRIAYYDVNEEIKSLKFDRNIEDLGQAIKDDNLRVYYQPKVNLTTGKIIGVEALMRWQIPGGELRLPKDFLYDVGAHPISLKLGHWLLNTVLMQMEVLHHNKIPMVSINVSSYEIQDKNFAMQVINAFKNHPNIPRECITFEILETELIEHVSVAKKLIHDMKAIGVRFSIDDYGTGYSSLTYIKELDVHQIKIDQSFIRNILEYPEDLAILKTTIDLCRYLKKEVIAEGVETPLHANLLMNLGCDLIQGYAIAKPMPLDELTKWTNSWHMNPGWLSSVYKKSIIDDFISVVLTHYTELKLITSYTKIGSVSRPEYHLHCPLEKWMIDQQSLFLDAKSFKKICQLHKKTHAIARTIYDFIQIGNINSAKHLLIEFDNESREFFRQLMTDIFGPRN